MAGAALRRGAALLLLWLVIGGEAGLTPADLVLGLLAAALGAWASLRLLPPRPRGVPAPRLAALAALALRLPLQALVAGAEVARRALSPDMRLRPGLVPFTPHRLAPGLRRDGFLALASLLPGTLPAGPGEGGAVRVHALDTRQPVAAEMAREEARFARALGERDDSHALDERDGSHALDERDCSHALGERDG